ncbi:MAG TPA: HAD family hydrolase [Candidatus Angelobacter sp.]
MPLRNDGRETGPKLLFWKVTFTCQVILFDLDGVLVDSTPAVAQVWNAWAIQHGLDPKVAVATAHGRRSIETIRLLAPHLDAEKENVRVESMEIEAKEGVVALPGAADLLHALPPERFAVVTSATRALALARLHYAGLPAPANLVSADDVRRGKPSPEPYLKGAALLARTPADCLVFEDVPNGIAAARAAGMQVVAITTTFAAKDLAGADARVNSLADVKAEWTSEMISLELEAF